MIPDWAPVIISAGILCAAVFVAWRSGFWRSQDQREAREARDTGRIERIDSNARAEIARVERELKAEVAKLGSAQAASSLDVAIRLTKVEETIRHLPTADQVAQLIDRLGRVEAGMAAVEVRMETQTELTRTIRDHILERE